jgi:hypothetical protein
MLLILLILFGFAHAQPEQVKFVHVVQSCHLDVGFAASAAQELDNYRGYFPKAMNISQDFRNNPDPNGANLIFMTHSYVTSLLLDCPPNMGFTCPTAAEVCRSFV